MTDSIPCEIRALISPLCEIFDGGMNFSEVGNFCSCAHTAIRPRIAKLSGHEVKHLQP